ncbi:hypothetical protein niasHS_003177 [Heterodera schachtii]|uniref:Uncharacterized protein n=1 Tax=Heterodera schachtii TaxID=97005 RepID=A0ABD2KGA8_HETSC
MLVVPSVAPWLFCRANWLMRNVLFCALSKIILVTSQSDHLEHFLPSLPPLNHHHHQFLSLVEIVSSPLDELLFGTFALAIRWPKFLRAFEVFTSSHHAQHVQCHVRLNLRRAEQPPKSVVADVIPMGSQSNSSAVASSNSGAASSSGGRREGGGRRVAMRMHFRHRRRAGAVASPDGARLIDPKLKVVKTFCDRGETVYIRRREELEQQHRN